MRILTLIFLTFAVGRSFASDAICYDDNNSFATQAPVGWIADFNQAKQLGLCVVYYMKGYTFDSSPAIIYPRLMTTEDQGDKAISRIISEDTDRLKKKGASELKVTEQPKTKNNHGLEFQFRHYANGPAPNEFEAVSYYAGKKAVLLSVFSTRSKDAFEKHNSKLKEFVMGIKPVSKDELKKIKK